MNLWKVLGLAGVAGVAAAGVIIAREQRQRTQLAPEEIRARLHERLEQAPAAPDRGTRKAGQEVPGIAGPHRRWRPPWRRRHAAPITIAGDS